VKAKSAELGDVGAYVYARASGRLTCEGENRIWV